MTTKLKIGFIALCDSAALIIAKERGFFAEQGLSVELCKEPSWANIRDKVAYGILDAAHMLAPMVLEATLGVGNVHVPLMSAVALSQGGVGITLTNIRPLPDKPVLAMVYPFSLHHYSLRHWMQGQKIEGDVVVVPPAQMVSSLSKGMIHGCCVGAPWNALAAQAGVGTRVALDPAQLRMDKVLGVAQGWAKTNPQQHAALIRAVVNASRWLEEASNQREAAEILAQPVYLQVAVDVIHQGLAEIHFVTEPSLVDARWYLEQMQLWGQVATVSDAEHILGRLYDIDTYKMAYI